MNDGPKLVLKKPVEVNPTDLVEIRKCSIKTKQFGIYQITRIRYY